MEIILFYIMTDNKRYEKIKLFIIVIIGIVVIDQITKYIAKNALLYLPDKTAQFINGFMRFRYIENSGMAFSLLSDATWFLTIISAVMASIVIYLLLKYYKDFNSHLFEYSLCFIAGGAIGNFIDRLTLGYVIDMLEFEFVNFAIFNVADCFVTFGAIMFGLFVLRRKDKASSCD